MLSDNALFPVVCLRREPGLLMLQISFGNFFESVLARRLMAEHSGLLDAQQFGGEDLLRLSDVVCVGLAPAPSVLSVDPRNPESLAVRARVHAITFFRLLLRHYFSALLRTIPRTTYALNRRC